MTSFDWKEFYDVGNHLTKHSKKDAYQISNSRISLIV